ncbi:hypothetical protein [Gracilibacillus alcaliphilus]|uniref:hypothetical protein n=1 Tax=Gracilibacillus alcaliphilus TaxID=1401441 RepID=UPI00195DFED1|nr:hypothetical protein [Gracilibacillus alcaliphilus]MBM7676474.1 hypothetical protein [Gracilibacillus alcaliphilus]
MLQLPNSYFDKGMEKGIEKVAIKLLSAGMPIEQVAEMTELERDVLEKLADK